MLFLNEKYFWNGRKILLSCTFISEATQSTLTVALHDQVKFVFAQPDLSQEFLDAKEVLWF